MVKPNRHSKTASTKSKEDELRRRLQKLFKNKPPNEKVFTNREEKQWVTHEIKPNLNKKKVNDNENKKLNYTNEPGLMNGKGSVQQQRQQRNKQAKLKNHAPTNRNSPTIETEVGKNTKKGQNKNKSNCSTQETSSRTKDTTTSNSKHQKSQHKKKKTRKRKVAERKSEPLKKQQLKQNVELPSNLLHIDSSEFSFSDFSDEPEVPDENYEGSSINDNSTESEYSFSNFQDDYTETSNGFMHEENFEDDDSDYDYEDDANMYCEEENDDFSDSFEDDEAYSDIYESDYGDTDDSADYADDINDDDFYNSGTVDEDYKLPEHVPEDLIIHKGTADKRDLYESDEVAFSEDCNGAQLIELRHQVCIKSIKQPEGYHRTALEELNRKEIDVSSQTVQQQRVQEIESDNDCPRLVPIVHEDGFEMWNEDLHSSESCESFDSSAYEECSDDDSSFVSIDVNSKYLQENEDYETSTNEDEGDKHMKNRKKNMLADVIEAIDTEDCTPSYFNDEYNNEDEVDIPPSKKFKKEESGMETVICTKVNEIKIETNKCPKGETKIMQENPKGPFKLSSSSNLQIENEMNLVLGTRTEEDIMQLIPSQIYNTEVENFSNPDVLDTSAVESTTSIKGNTSKISASTTPTVSRFPSSIRSIFCNAIDSNDVLVLLRESLAIYGTLKLNSIAGSIEIYGYTPKHGEELEIFSPRGLSSVQIAPKPSKQATPKKLNNELIRLEKHFSKAELNKIREDFNPVEDSLILLKRNDTRKKLVGTFKKYMNENVFPNMNSIQRDRPFHSSECRLRCVINSSDEYNDRALKMNIQWEQLEVQANSKILLIGGKSVGKSTLLRVLVNRSLMHYPCMLVIDLDIGQPELFIPQTISASLVDRPLLGPGFFLNHQPIMSFAIGHSNIVLCPHRYMHAVKELLKFCHSQPELAQLPWFINTMGYNKGFGAELLAVICDYLQPTDVVQLQSNKDINNYDYLMDPNVVATLTRNIYSGSEYKVERTDQVSCLNYQLHVFNSAITQESRYQRDWGMASKDLRYANMLSRLSGIFSGHAEWFSDCKPLCASLDDLKFLNLLSSGFTREQILKSIEANLVYLCHQDDYETAVRCFGIGVVRAIDYHFKKIYLIPALPQHLISEVNCLAIGEMPLPTSMLTNQGPKVKDIVPYLYNTIHANASKSIKQIFYRPPQFLGGKHKNMNELE